MWKILGRSCFLYEKNLKDLGINSPYCIVDQITTIIRHWNTFKSGHRPVVSHWTNSYDYLYFIVYAYNVPTNPKELILVCTNIFILDTKYSTNRKKCVQFLPTTFYIDMKCVETFPMTPKTSKSFWKCSQLQIFEKYFVYLSVNVYFLSDLFQTFRDWSTLYFPKHWIRFNGFIW